MKQWDRIHIKAYGEASFEYADWLGIILKEHGYKEISRGSGQPENSAPWLILEYDQPVEEEEPFVGGTTPTYFAEHKEYDPERDEYHTR